VVHLHLVQLVLQGLQFRRVRGFGQLRLVVVGLECADDVLGVIDDIEYDELVASMTSEEFALHQLLLDIRDKHIAHSVNDFESPAV
jgi:hypothetical protein